MRHVLLAALALLLLAASAHAQLCVKYGGNNQTLLMTTVIGEVFTAVTSDPQIVGWFNGSFGVKGHVFVGPNANSALVDGLFDKLVSFFGTALGCTDPAFSGTGEYSASTTGVSTDLTAIHASSNFQVAIPKLPYELFNIHILNVLFSNGVSTEDLYTVSTVLDVFRGPGLQGGSASYQNSICQGTDCYSSPFTIYMNDNVFLPSYYAVPTGNTVYFYNNGSSPHEPAASTAAGVCNSIPSGGFNAGKSIAAGESYTTPALKTAGTVYFDCTLHCNLGMNGSFTVMAVSNPTTTGSGSGSGSAANLVLAFSAMLAALFAMLF